MVRMRLGSDHAANRCLKRFKLYWFYQMFGKACLQTLFDVAVVAETADGNSGDAGYGVQLHHQFQAGPIRQRNIADEKIELIADRGFHGGAHIVRSCNEVTAPNEQPFQSSAGVLMIVH